MGDDVAQFVGITGASVEDAERFLALHRGDLEVAIDGYFTARHEGGPRVSPTAAAGLRPPDPPPKRGLPEAKAPAPKKPASAKPQPAGPFRTLADFRSAGGPGGSDGDDDDDDDDDDEGRKDRKGTTTYAGGRSSGLAVQHPGKRRDDDIAKEILAKARERGAVDVADFQRAAAAGAGGAFHGAGYRLGGVATPAEEHRPLRETARPERHFTIHLWTDGFSVDEGPLRAFQDPASRAFLEAVKAGDVPPELQQQLLAEADPKAPPPKIFVHLEQKGAPYQPPPKTFKAFSGAGYSLSDAAAATSPAVSPPSHPTAAPGPGLQVDEAKPVTTLQIRLADGTRLQARFNLHHTVEDIRGFIDRSRPQGRPYDIITTMPRQVFSDGKQTIEAAGLKNAALVQHLR